MTTKPDFLDEKTSHYGLDEPKDAVIFKSDFPESLVATPTTLSGQATPISHSLDPELFDEKAANPKQDEHFLDVPVSKLESPESTKSRLSSTSSTSKSSDLPPPPTSHLTTNTINSNTRPSTQATADPNANADDVSDLERVLTHLSYSAPPDGGYGWTNVLLVFLINAHTWGLNSSYAIFLSHYLSSATFPGATRLQYAFIGGLSVGCAFLVSPLVVVSIRKVGTTPTLLLGACIEGGSLIAASFATRIWQLALAQGVAFGVGMGVLFVGSVGIVSQWFSTRRSLANGIATAGSGVGGLIYSLATGAMIRNLGLAWAFRILGILGFVVNGFCALLIRDRYAVIGVPRRRLEVSLFGKAEYWLLLGFGAFSMLGYIVLLFSLASYARSIGLSSSQAANIAAFLNLGQAVGRPLVGYFSDVTGRINMAASASFLGGIFALVIWTNATSYGVLVFFALIMGMVAGTFFATISPLSAEVVGLERVPSALNIVWLVLVIPCTFSEAIGLETVQSEGGSYLGARLFSGFMYVGAALCLFLLRGWKIAEVERVRAAMGREVDAAVVDEVAEKSIKEAAQREGWHVFLRNTMKWKKV